MADGVAGPVPRAPAGGVSRGLALLVAGAMFMEILDATVIAPAAPHIAADLGVAAVDIDVAITAHVLTLAVLIRSAGGRPGQAGHLRDAHAPLQRGRRWESLASRHPIG